MGTDRCPIKHWNTVGMDIVSNFLCLLQQLIHLGENVASFEINLSLVRIRINPFLDAGQMDSYFLCLFLKMIAEHSSQREFWPKALKFNIITRH